MDVLTEGVVTPDDVTKQLVVSPVVGCVDDSLLLPGAPRVRADGGERDPEPAGQLVELGPALADLRRRFGKVLAAAGPDLDLRRDQLADEVLFERRALSRGLKLLEPVRERERLGVEDGELLLDGEREIGAVLVRLSGCADLLVGCEPLRVPH